jgi:hypothetical protein
MDYYALKNEIFTFSGDIWSDTYLQAESQSSQEKYF